MTAEARDAVHVLAVKATARRNRDDHDSPVLTIRDDEGDRIDAPITDDAYHHLTNATDD